MTPMTQLSPDRCANCQRVTVGADQQFCPACGQPTPAPRIDWPFLRQEMQQTVLQMERGLLYSLTHLMVRPGHLMRDYIEGRRASQVKPLPLLLTTAGVVVVLGAALLGGDVMGSAMPAGYDGAARVPTDGQAGAASVMTAFAAMKAWMNRHFAATTLLMLPLEAAAFRLAFWRVGDVNYPEWLVITTYLTAQTFVLWTMGMLLQTWVPQSQAWVLSLSIAYGVFSLVQYFQGYPRWKSVMRSLLGFAIFLLMNTALTFLLVPLVLLLTK
jgi:hypothetical protein